MRMAKTAHNTIHTQTHTQIHATTIKQWSELVE